MKKQTTLEIENLQDEVLSEEIDKKVTKMIIEAEEDIKEGYKKTELGFIPIDWKIGELKDLINIKHGYAFEGEYFSKIKSENILLTPGNFHISGKLYFGNNTTYFLGEIPKNYIFSNGDLAIVMTDMTASMNILGNTVIIKSDKIVLHNQRIGKILINDSKILNEKFLCLFLNYDLCKNVIKSSASGTTVRHTSPDKILKCKIFIPDLTEQKKIASIISTWDNAIEKTEKLIEIKNKLKKALMQQLLTGKKRFKEFIKYNEYKQTELGFIPFDWEIEKFGKYSILKGGYAFSSKDSSKIGVKWLKIANVSIGNIDWSEKSFLPEKYSINYKDYLLEKNNIVIAMTRPLLDNRLKVAIVTEKDLPSLLNQRVGKFIFNENLNYKFGFYIITSFKFIQQIISKIFGTDPPNISSNDIENIKIIFIPDIEEQKKIASVLTSCDKEIELLEKKLDVLKNQKKGLMQKLLTGQIRVKIDI